MTTSNSKKLTNFIKNQFSFEKTDLKEKHTELIFKWYYFLLPKTVRDLLIDLVVECSALKFRNEMFLDTLVEQNALLVTYQNNSKIQKEKTKKYSALRRNNRLRKELEKGEASPVVKDFSLESVLNKVEYYHEHEEGL